VVFDDQYPDYMTQNGELAGIMNCKGFGRKQSRPNQGTIPACAKWAWQNHKTSGQLVSQLKLELTISWIQAESIANAPTWLVSPTVNNSVQHFNKLSSESHLVLWCYYATGRRASIGWLSRGTRHSFQKQGRKCISNHNSHINWGFKSESHTGLGKGKKVKLFL
jgi:hypothetical protein